MLLCAQCNLSTAELFSDMSQTKKIKNIFPSIAPFKKTPDSSSSSIILNESFLKPSVHAWAQLCSIPAALDSLPAAHWDHVSQSHISSSQSHHSTEAGQLTTTSAFPPANGLARQAHPHSQGPDLQVSRVGFWYPAFSPGRRTSQNKQVLEITDCPTLFPRASDFPILFWVFTFEASINSRFHFFTFETSFYSCLGFWRGRGKIRDCPQEKVMLCSFITYTSEDRMESAKLLLLKQMQTVQAFSFCFVPFLNGVYVQLKLLTSRQIWMIYIKFWLFFSTLQAKEPFSALSLRAAQLCSRLTKLPCSSSIFPLFFSPLNKFLHWTSSWFA